MVFRKFHGLRYRFLQGLSFFFVGLPPCLELLVHDYPSQLFALYVFLRHHPKLSRWLQRFRGFDVDQASLYKLWKVKVLLEKSFSLRILLFVLDDSLPDLPVVIEVTHIVGRRVFLLLCEVTAHDVESIHVDIPDLLNALVILRLYRLGLTIIVAVDLLEILKLLRFLAETEVFLCVVTDASRSALIAESGVLFHRSIGLQVEITRVDTILPHHRFLGLNWE